MGNHEGLLVGRLLRLVSCALYSMINAVRVAVKRWGVATIRFAIAAKRRPQAHASLLRFGCGRELAWAGRLP